MGARISLPAAEAVVPAGAMPRRLDAYVAASTNDAYYEAAFVVCRDIAAGRSIALSRSPDRSLIDLTVDDTLSHALADLDLRWDGVRLTLWLDAPAAERLGGHRCHEVRVIGADTPVDAVSDALRTIFDGKRGLQLLA